MDKIDFRSDTVTWPTPAMYAAMQSAPLGDDVYGEDPTVNRLEALAAERTGKEAGLFVASGTMGNLVSILAHAGRGDEALVGEASHTYCWEAGGMAALGGVVPRVLAQDDFGRYDLAAVRASIRPDNPHLPTSRLILLESSVGGRHGVPLPLDYMADIRAIADQHGLRVHLDGARLFNAAVALGVPASDITRHVDSVTFCLSKGLCAPLGSMVCGSAELIHRARRMRKLVGGGMRQAGVPAAAGIVALEQMVERLADDHRHARQLAEGLARLPGIVIDVQRVSTNMVFFELAPDLPLTALEVAERLASDYNVWVDARSTANRRAFRAVVHYWTGSAEVDTLLTGLRHILAALPAPLRNGRHAAATPA
jgi:threonine aldolase